MPHAAPKWNAPPDGQLVAQTLAELARRIRIGSVVPIYFAGSGHPGGCLSAADILACVWAKEIGRHAEKKNGTAPNRFILSKGHACAALYAVAAEFGLIPHRLLPTLRKLGSPLQGHTHVLDTPWTQTSTGSLGQGFSVAIGMAMGFRFRRSQARVYVMLGDGELQEGEVWEGAMCAGHYKLDNLCGIVDYNKMQSDDVNENIMGLEPLRAKWEAFRWHVVEIDGHDLDQIEGALTEARRTKGRPTMIIAHTIKGKGVSFMEGSPLWHGSVKLREEEVQQALRDLGVDEAEIPGYLNGSIWN
jgi:transketolase